MPQLDLTTYMTQFVWFTGAFLTFYFWMTFDYLPALKRAFGIRAAYTQTQESEGKAFQVYTEEKTKHQKEVNAEMQKVFQASKAIYQSASSESQTWFAENQKKVVFVDFEKAHTSFLQAITYTQQEPQVFEQILKGQKTKK